MNKHIIQFIEEATAIDLDFTRCFQVSLIIIEDKTLLFENDLSIHEIEKISYKKAASII